MTVVYGAGKVFDLLLDRLHDMGAPPPDFGRVSGSHNVYIQCVLPVGATERVGPTLDQVARAIIDFDLSCSDKDREAAESSLS